MLWTVSIFTSNRSCARAKKLAVATDPNALYAALADHADGLVRAGVEASSLGVWVHRELQSRGLPMITVEARHMRHSLSAMRNKTDRNDARGIGQMMRLGWFRAVHVKCVENQKLKTLLANRRLLKRKLIDLENHIRGALRTSACGSERSAGTGSKRACASFWRAPTSY
ncbi:IS110 family transposase [Roseibium aggregatum]|uniref:IS110 family transposase n=1 Tax=Roseibium aggregatum TaxID=187304 RepID=UPI002E2B0423|nr:transposase [Roseibium aggregatum]